MIDAKMIEALVDAVVSELESLAEKPKPAATKPQEQPQIKPPPQPQRKPQAQPEDGLEAASLMQTTPLPGIKNPVDPEGLLALKQTTTARICAGHAGPRLRTEDLLAFQADLAITKDALEKQVNPSLLEEFGLFTVGTKITGGKEEYLLRPDLGRQLSDEAKKIIAERCTKKPDVQICVGDGLSARAIEANLAKIFPVLKAGCETAGLSMGTPFFIERCRVGVMNDIGDLLEPQVVILLIGERPGLGRADSMSAYMGYKPHEGLTDADRDVICNIFDGGGVNPLEAGAYAIRLAERMIKKGASGIQLKLLEGEET
jgi:ethanolamine ammonia-lyase small subunit